MCHDSCHDPQYAMLCYAMLRVARADVRCASFRCCMCANTLEPAGVTGTWHGLPVCSIEWGSSAYSWNGVGGYNIFADDLPGRDSRNHNC